MTLYRIFRDFLYRITTAAGALSNALGERAAGAHCLLDVASAVGANYPLLQAAAYMLEFLKGSRWPPNGDD